MKTKNLFLKKYYKPSNVYIISNGEEEYKVGFSINPKRRVKQLQTGTTKKLKLEYFVELEYTPAYIIEDIMHKYFKDNKISGEWFKCDFKILKNILDYVKMRYDNEETESLYKLKQLNWNY